MRKRFRVLVLAAIVAAVVVPVGFALSLDALVSSHSPRPAVVSSSGTVFSGAALIVSTEKRMPAASEKRPAASALALPDGAKLFFVGTALLGLAAAVRRAT